jgi:hypothetical protein
MWKEDNQNNDLEKKFFSSAEKIRWELSGQAYRLRDIYKLNHVLEKRTTRHDNDLEK